MPPGTWAPSRGEFFSCRTGPNYDRNKLKSPSAAALFEVVGVDLLSSTRKINHIAQQADLQVCKEQTVSGVPTTLLVNFQMPAYGPGWGGRQDGEGYSLVVKMEMTEVAREQVHKQSTAPARLFTEFAKKYYHSEKLLHSRLKAIGRCVNLDELNFGWPLSGTVAQFNGKPFLTGPKCHTFYEGEKDKYIEVDVDFHSYCWPFKKAAHKVLDHTYNMTFDLALVVEAQRDREMPEQILGCLRLNRLNGPLHSLPVV